MHAVVNKLSLGKPIDPALLSKIKDGLGKLLADQPDFVSVKIVEVNDEEAILIALYKTEQGMNEISKNVAAPWFAEHVRPYLAGPVDRAVGEVVLEFANGG